LIAPSKSLSKVEIGHGGTNTHYGDIRADEFLRELKGKKGIKKFREMRDNDATIGAIMYATEQVLRDVPKVVTPADDSEQAKEYAEYLESIFDDMEHTLDDHISEALSSLTYGFAVFEVVYKRRGGPDFLDKKRNSKYSDGLWGVRKLASRAQWTIQDFDVDKRTGDVLGVRQDFSLNGMEAYIPKDKIIHYRTTNVNNDPSGRSILRNAYKSYTFLTNLQTIEAIAVERELHGVPVGRMPAEYLGADATDDQKSLRQSFEQILRDLKLNEQGYALLPSDIYSIDDKATNIRMMDVELITSNGTRNIDIDPIIKRYQHDISRSVMAEFLMLGGGSTGSYALSKSKTDLFLRSMESYINSIYDVLNKQLVEPLWVLNGFPVELMPKIKAGDVAPHDLKELGSYLRNLNGANIDLSNQPNIINELLDTAELPNLDEALYAESQDQKKQLAQAKVNKPTQPGEPSG
jgi:phage gp29-like protein